MQTEDALLYFGGLFWGFYALPSSASTECLTERFKKNNNFEGCGGMSIKSGVEKQGNLFLKVRNYDLRMID